MAVVCPSCEVDPPRGTTVGMTCLGCGARLIAVATPEDLIGTVIEGRFEIVARLGAGGMGTVYRAIQRSIGREVAIKVLDHGFERDVAAAKRFFREAKLASTLGHPSSVEILDFGQSQDGQLYLAMELVRGKTLHREIEEQGALPLGRVCGIGGAICDLLEVAHGRGIVHRDLKLDNVMLVDGGRDRIKVLDFGLARSLVDPTSRATASGVIAGTPRYMAPEVFDAAPPKPAQDLYAFGVMLAELALGRPLWSATTLEGLFSQKLSFEGSLGDVPEVLRPLVRSLLDHAPEARPDAAAAHAALRALGGAGLGVVPTAGGSQPAMVAMTVPAATPPADGLAGFSAANLVGLDERRDGVAATVIGPHGRESDPARPLALEGLPVPKPRVATAPPVPPSEPVMRFAPPASAFQAPATPAARALELDPQWVATQKAKQDTPATPRLAVPQPPVKPKPKPKARAARGGGTLVLGAVVVGLLVGGGVLAKQYLGKDRSMITLRITAPVPVDVTVNGQLVGRTPVEVEMPRRNQQALIEARGFVTRHVGLEYDQVVELTTPANTVPPLPGR
jgi:hypothetical protein